MEESTGKKTKIPFIRNYCQIALEVDLIDHISTIPEYLGYSALTFIAYALVHSRLLPKRSYTLEEF